MPGFLTCDKVKQMLTADHLSPIGKPVVSINLREMEEALEAKDLLISAPAWDRNAEKMMIIVSN